MRNLRLNEIDLLLKNAKISQSIYEKYNQKKVDEIVNAVVLTNEGKLRLEQFN